MRILPIHINGNFVNSTKSAYKNMENNANNLSKRPQSHQYTGVASVDLAYASMFDNEIARDLKLMGLI